MTSGDLVGIDRTEYEQGEQSLVVPASLVVDASYYYRRLATRREKRQLGAYAVEKLVGVKSKHHIGEGYYQVGTRNYFQADCQPETLRIGPDGYVVRPVHISSLMTAWSANLPEGYLMGSNYELGDPAQGLSEDHPLVLAH